MTDLKREAILAKMKELKLKESYKFSKELYEVFDIKELIYKNAEGKEQEEEWKFVKFYDEKEPYNKLRKYMVSTYGRVVNVEKGREVAQHHSSNNCKTASGEKYRYVNLSFCGEHGVYAVHRLVAMAFIKRPKHKNVVDHIDEHPYNNFVWNLQWTDKSANSNKHNMYVARERTGKAVDTSWKYDELVAICTMMAEGHKATYIYNEMLRLTNNNPKIQYERIRTLYKHIMRRGDFHDIAVKCGVNFESNYLKETGSVKKAQELKNSTH